ncbi:MAG: hypothetical protein FWD61_11770 [Phycisphaerales bacterium]|nr:hypothetical protein [Phycisphaerales bacterium]
MMTIHAIIKEGKVVPTEPLPLADGTKVTITPLELEDQEPTNVADLFRKFVGVIDNLPSDLSTNHDHYLYGVPKKKP